jgi:hypothetical protein
LLALDLFGQGVRAVEVEPRSGIPVERRRQNLHRDAAPGPLAAPPVGLRQAAGVEPN